MSNPSNKEPIAFGISAKLAKALADTWRFRILVEATVRPLSPSEFVESYGGDLGQVSRAFRQLSDWGYLKIAEERPGRRNGTALEHVYEAARLAHFDTSIWEGIPLPARNAVSHSILSSYFRRVGIALEAGTFDAEVERHLSWDAIALDRRAWTQIAARLDELLGLLPQLEEEARKRLNKHEEETIPAIVSLTSFRSPQAPAKMLEAPRRHEGPTTVNALGAAYGIGAQLAKALSNRWRCQIIMEASIRPISPSQFVEQVGGSKTNISRHFRQLADWGYLALIEERKGGRRGGGVEKLYRSTCRAYFDTPTWECLPQVIREEISQYFFDSYLRHVVEAIEMGTFDAETDRHLSWKPLTLDRLAWKTIGYFLDEILASLPELESESLKRTDGNVDLLIPTVVSLAMFRMPAEET